MTEIYVVWLSALNLNRNPNLPILDVGDQDCDEDDIGVIFCLQISEPDAESFHCKCMRAPLPFLACLLTPLFVTAQTVDFNQNRTFQTTQNRKIIGPDCQPLVGTNFVAQLYYEMFEGAPSLTPVPQFNRFRNVPSTDPLAGTWVGATRTLTGRQSGDNVTLQVFVWDQSQFATVEQARASGALWGASFPFTYTVPAPGSLPSAFYIENFRGFFIGCPEPSTVTLGVVGVVALFALRRLRHAKK